MSEATETTESAEATETEAAASTEETQSPTETVDFWKSKAREQEKRAKANAEAAKKLSEIEEQQKTETERLQDKLAAESAQREQFEKQAMRYRVATVKGIPADLVDRLKGDTEEELAADADVLLARITPAEDTGKTPGPRPDLSQGGSGTGNASGGPEKDFANFMRGQLG